MELGIGFDRDGLDDAVDGDPRRHPASCTTCCASPSPAAARRAGSPPVGGSSSLLIMLDAFDPAMMLKPVALSSTAIRRNPRAVSCRLKTLSYIDNIAAAREAASHGVEDALMLNTEGNVACSTIANIFLLKGRTLITPSRDQGILTGVTRQTLLHSAAHLGLKAEERAVRPGELREADARVPHQQPALHPPGHRAGPGAPAPGRPLRPRRVAVRGRPAAMRPRPPHG